MISEPRVKFLRLWERESRNGRRYFAGFLGGLGVVMFRDEKAQPREGVIAEWEIFLSERDAQRPAPENAPAPPRTSVLQRQAAPKERAPAGNAVPFHNDPLDDIGRGQS
jgi:hypothetical protein